MKFGFKILTAIFVLSVPFAGLVAEEKKDGPAINYGVEFHQRGEVETTNHVIATRGGLADSPIFFRNEVKGWLSKSFADGLYTLGGYAKDRFDIRVSQSGTGLIANRFRNRVYWGITNKINIKGVMAIQVDFDTKVTHDIRNNFSTTLTPTVSIGPTIGFSGKYDFGLSWLLKQTTWLDFAARPSDGQATYDLTNVELDQYYQLAFEFFHFFVPNKKIKGSVYAKAYVEWALPNDNFDGGGGTKTNSIADADTEIGFKLALWGFSWYTALYMEPLWSNFETGNTGMMFMGFTTGVNFSVDWFSMYFKYVGNALTSTWTGGTTTNPTNIQWTNYFQAGVKLKLKK
jgi:hypothetical protein